MNEFKCTEIMCSLIPEAQANEVVDFGGKVNVNRILKKVLEGKKVLRNSYPTIYGEPEDVRKFERALHLIKLELAKLGYHFENLNDPAISASIIYNFQRLCGIYDGAGGTLIGEKTLNALITASAAGKNWKKEVAGMYDESPTIDTNVLKEIKGIRERLSNLSIKRGLYLGGVQKNEKVELVRKAYAAIGFDVEGENLIFANYKFQILSGVNEARNLAPIYGHKTHRVLLKAFKTVEKGKNWREAFNSH